MRERGGDEAGHIGPEQGLRSIHLPRLRRQVFTSPSIAFVRWTAIMGRIVKAPERVWGAPART
jgi:hypothetical protein